MGCYRRRADGRTRRRTHRRRAIQVDRARAGTSGNQLAAACRVRATSTGVGCGEGFHQKWRKMSAKDAVDEICRDTRHKRRLHEASAMLESATQGIYMFYNSFGGVAGMYAAVEDCVRDERNRQQALQDEMEGTLEARYGMRAEERRVGEEWRARWARYH